MKKVLVTGATGFIGDYVIQELLKQGHTVIATSLNPEKARESDWFSEVTYIPFDLATAKDTINYFELFGRPEIVIHLAWEGLPNYRSSFHLTVNLPRHLKFLRNLIHHGTKDITITGTCFEYGMQEGCLNENMPSMPDNPYAIAKNELRKALETLQQENTFSLKWVRPFYMYGRGQNPKSLVPQLESALQKGDAVFNMSGGEQLRDFMPVNEVASHIVKIAMQKDVSGIINIATNKPVTVKQFVLEYIRSKNKQIHLNLGFYPYPDYEPMSFWGDNSKLKSIKIR